MNISVKLIGLASATACIFGAVAEAATPAPFRTVAAWAQEARYVRDSPRPGKWDNEFVPEAVEIMDCLDETHPARNVWVVGSAQFVKTEVGLNFVGHTIEDDPCGFILALPSLNELKIFNDTKLQSMIDATKTLNTRVLGLVERSGNGSSTYFKKFRGGYISLVTASSSKGLQARSCPKGWGDEVTGFPADVGGRGSPIKQIVTRGDAFAKSKFLWTSTPGELPGCVATKGLEGSDYRIRYHECPHCGDWTNWLVEDLVETGDQVAIAPRCCGALIHENQKTAIRKAGRWIKVYEDLLEDGTHNPANPSPPEVIPGDQIDAWHARPSNGREPGFTFNQTLSPLKPWSVLFAESQEAEKGSAADKKTFCQQKKGLAWDPDTESADADILFAARGKFVGERGVVPSWACRITLGVDVQGNRLEWAAYAWGPQMSGARFDWGEIDGDPTRRLVWQKLDADIVPKKWSSRHLIDLAADGIGIDSGGQDGVTPQVYGFVGRRAGLYAMKGDTGAQAQSSYLWRSPKVARAKLAGRTVSTTLFLLANNETKSAIAGALRASIVAADEKEFIPGGIYLTSDTTLEHVKQLTAERYVPPPATRPHGRGTWQRAVGQANEQLDLCRMAFGLNWHQTQAWDSARWQREFIARAKPPETADAPPMLEMMMAQVEVAPAVALPQNPTPHPTAPRRPTLTKIGGIFDRG
jgi:phage terminase large subunit GpA-like protein